MVWQLILDVMLLYNVLHHFKLNGCISINISYLVIIIIIVGGLPV